MTSSRLAANRRNARRSTGPRSASGKLTAARNALRHGFRVLVSADPVLANEIVELVERLINGSKDAQMRELAVRVAAAQVDVQRVRHARHGLIARRAIGAHELQKLCTFGHYERQAMWRRTLAIRAWEATLFRSIGGAQ